MHSAAQPLRNMGHNTNTKQHETRACTGAQTQRMIIKEGKSSTQRVRRAAHHNKTPAVHGTQNDQ